MNTSCPHTQVCFLSLHCISSPAGMPYTGSAVHGCVASISSDCCLRTQHWFVIDSSQSTCVVALRGLACVWAGARLFIQSSLTVTILLHLQFLEVILLLAEPPFTFLAFGQSRLLQTYLARPLSDHVHDCRPHWLCTYWSGSNEHTHTLVTLSERASEKPIDIGTVKPIFEIRRSQS